MDLREKASSNGKERFPFSMGINLLYGGPGAMVDGKFVLAMANTRRREEGITNDRANILIVAPRNVFVRQERYEPTRKDSSVDLLGERIGSLMLGVDYSVRRRTIYIGESYEVVFVNTNGEEANFIIHSNVPVEIEVIKDREGFRGALRARMVSNI